MQYPDGIGLCCGLLSWSYYCGWYFKYSRNQLEALSTRKNKPGGCNPFLHCAGNRVAQKQESIKDFFFCFCKLHKALPPEDSELIHLRHPVSRSPQKCIIVVTNFPSIMYEMWVNSMKKFWPLMFSVLGQFTHATLHWATCVLAGKNICTASFVRNVRVAPSFCWFWK